MAILRVCLRAAPVVVLLYAFVVGSATSRAEQPTTIAAVQLMLDGRLGEGAKALGLDRPYGADVLAKARRCRERRLIGDALALYEVYFRDLAFGLVDWHEVVRDEWTTAAKEYVALLRATPGETSAASLQSIAALELHQRLLEADDLAERRKLTEEIITKYPQSTFAPAAAMTLISLGLYHDDGTRRDDESQIVAALLKTMERAGISEERRFPVLLEYQRRVNVDHFEAGTKAPTIITVDDVLRLARNPVLRREFLWEDRARPREQAEVRKFWERYLEECRYEPEEEIHNARYNVLRSYRDGDETEFRRWIDLWAADPQLPTPRSKLLLAAAGQRVEAERWPEALTLYDEVIRSGESVVEARWGKALAYKRAGRTAEMAVVLHEMTPRHVAGAPDRATPNEAQDSAPFSMDRYWKDSAIQELARHYTDSKQWKEALAEWERWRPSSGCGTCSDAMEKTRAENIALCRRMLKQP